MTLNNRIDFMFVIYANNCNPNGDPTTGMPRIGFDDIGEISNVCLKRKIRDYLCSNKEEILVLPTSETGDSLKSAIKKSGIMNHYKKKSLEQEELKKAACKKWIDVRAFGAVIALSKSSDFMPLSIGIRGAMSLSTALSIEPITMFERPITTCLNNDIIDNLDKNTFGGSKWVVKNTVYVSYGSIYPQLAELTGFTDEDAEKLKQAIIHMFDIDASSSRPAGSMILTELHWWTHNCRSGQYNIAKVHHSLSVIPTDEFPFYKINENYKLDNLKHDIYKFTD